MENKKLYQKVSKNLTKAMVGIFIALFAIFVALSTVPSDSKLLYVGKFIHWCVSFLVGSIFSYIVYALTVCYGISLIFSYKKKVKITLNYTILGLIFAFFGTLILIANAISFDASTNTYLTFANFSDYFNVHIVSTFPNVDSFKNGGIVGLFLAALINSGMTNIGSNVIGSVLIVLGAFFAFAKPVIKFIKYLKDYIGSSKKTDDSESVYYSAKDMNYDYKEIKNSVSEDFYNSDSNFAKTEENNQFVAQNKPENPVFETKPQEQNHVYYRPDNEKDELVLNPTLGLVKAVYDVDEENKLVAKVEETKPIEPAIKEEVFEDETEVSEFEEEEIETEEETHTPPVSTYHEFKDPNEATEPAYVESFDEENITEPQYMEQKEEVQEEQIENSYANKTEIKKKKKIAWHNVSDKLLQDRKSEEADNENIRVSEERSGKINVIFNDLGVKARVIGYTIGPSVTRFDVEPDKSTKIAVVSKCMEDIYRRLGGLEGRFTPIVQGKITAGIELPNEKSSIVNFKECYRALDDSRDVLDVVFGKNINGEIITGDLCEFPHLLVAGTTGSGKSIFIHGLIMSLIMKHSPADLKLVMIDPKRVEFSKYKDGPHLLCPVINDPNKAYIALIKLCKEMDQRYDLLERNGCSNIGQYNEYAEENGLERMNFIVVIVDEFADLMDTNRKCSEPIARLGQKARACGIHLIIATQRPSVNVITGVIKANIPSRVALSCSSPTDSMTILNEGGAENLLGKGDMLISCGALSRKDLLRVQGCYVSAGEIREVMSFLKEHYEVEYSPEYLDLEERNESTISVNELRLEKEAANEDRYQEIKNWVMTNDYTSISKIQNKFQLGFPKASKYFNRLAEEGVISNVNEANNAKGRRVLLHDFSKIAEQVDEARGHSLESSTMDYSKKGEDY